MKTLTEIISALVEENRVARQAHRAKVEKRAEELNAGWAKTRFGREYFDKVVAPTWGKDDRPHAPFDGYLCFIQKSSIIPNFYFICKFWIFYCIKLPCFLYRFN